MNVNASALSALSTAAAVSANNVANVNTEGFQASHAELASGPGGQGVRVASIRRDTSPGPIVSDPVRGRVELSNVNLATEMVDMTLTQRAYQANAKAVSVSESLQGHLINTMV